MSDLNDFQYRAISKTETAQGNPLSIRFFRDFARNINNYRAKVGCHKLISDMYPSDSPLTSFNGTADTELVQMFYAPRFVPNGSNYALVQVNHVRKSAAGSTIWKLYATDRLYRKLNSDDVFVAYPVTTETYKYSLSCIKWELQTATLTSTDFVATWTTDSGSNEMINAVMNINNRDDKGNVWFILTSENDATDTESVLFSVDVTPLTEDIST
jgi:hypothetical protein